MPGRRDDIVMRPRLADSQRVTNAKGRQKEARQLQLLDKGGKGMRGKIAAVQAARRYARKRQQASRQRHLVQLAGKARRGMGVAGRGVGRAVTRTPWGMILAGVAAAGAIVTKLATGRTFGQMAIDFKRKLIGDQDLEAASASSARRTVTSNDILMRQLAVDGDTTLAKRIYNLHRNRDLLYLKGRQAIEQEIGVNSVYDDFVETRWANMRKDIVAAFGEDSMVLTAIADFAKVFRASYQTNIIDKPNR